MSDTDSDNGWTMLTVIVATTVHTAVIGTETGISKETTTRVGFVSKITLRKRTALFFPTVTSIKS